jgi:hypothetical protein
VDSAAAAAEWDETETLDELAGLAAGTPAAPRFSNVCSLRAAEECNTASAVGSVGFAAAPLEGQLAAVAGGELVLLLAAAELVQLELGVEVQQAQLGRSSIEA